MSERPPERRGAAFLRQTLRRCRGALATAGAFSFVINLLMLTGSLYSLQVFDRVLTSRSVSTLIYLSLIALAALLVLWLLDLARAQVMTAIGTWFDERLGPRLLAAAAAGTAPTPPGPAAAQPLRDRALLRNFLVGPHLFPIMDAPWAPVLLLVLFMLHPLLGAIALGGAVILLALAAARDRLTKTALERAAALTSEGVYDSEVLVRNADSVRAMGLMPHIAQRWTARNATALGYIRHAAFRANLLSSFSRLIRQVLQIAMLGVGAWLALKGEITAGALIASSIFVARALAPMELAIAAARQAVSARQAYRRIETFIDGAEGQRADAMLFRVKGRVSAEDVIYAFPGGKEPTLKGVSFKLEPGESMAIMGPSGSGKTTLSRLMVGALRPNAGAVRIDGADVAGWNAEQRGPHVGYVAQSVELFRGTVEENIARMGEPVTARVTEAAELARAHEMIQTLPAAYRTPIGEAGLGLSGGQRQKIGLARALYGEPRLVVLDEPNAHHDQHGEVTLIDTIKDLKQRGVTVAVVTHRPSLVEHVDKILILRDGKVAIFGPRLEVLSRLTPSAATRPLPAKPGVSHA